METDKNILRGPVCQLTLPPDLSLGQFMLNRLHSHDDRVALINSETNEQKTYAEILSESLKLAVYLTGQGLKKDDRMVVCSENSLVYGIPVCSALYLGVAVCPMNPDYSRGEFLHALNISKPKYIFASESVLETLCDVVRELSWSPKVICMGNNAGGKARRMKDLIGSVEAPDPDNFKVCSLNPRDHVAAIMCSSGTTGLPKGVMLTDTNFLTVTRSIMEASSSLAHDSTSLALLPYFHSYAFVTMTNKFLLGATAVMMPRFNPERFLALIEKYKITLLFLVPPLLIYLAKSPLVDKYDLSSVQRVWCGAAPLSPHIAKTVCKRLNISNISQGYGMTETTLGVLRTPLGCDKHGSVGCLGPEVSAKVMPLDEDGSKVPLGPNQRGELCFKGDQIMKGYCGDVSSTSATIDKDGWLHTGDIGYYDEEGYFYIVDRLKELIKYKSFQVPPAELEAILLTHSQIVDVAVIGIPDETSGELPMAFVVKQPGSNVTAEEIVQFVNGQVSKQKWLRGGVKFIDAIPKTPAGKILRRELRDSFKSKI